MFQKCNKCTSGTERRTGWKTEHPDRKTVSVKNLENGEIFEENYDKLILSPGAKPTQPRLPGIGIDRKSVV